MYIKLRSGYLASSHVVVRAKCNFMDAALRSLANATAAQDKLFGPTLRDVEFDFTLLFERSVLSIRPSALFLIYAPLRAHWLRGEQKKVKWSRLVMGKQVRTSNTISRLVNDSAYSCYMSCSSPRNFLSVSSQRHLAASLPRNQPLQHTPSYLP